MDYPLVVVLLARTTDSTLQPTESGGDGRRFTNNSQETPQTPVSQKNNTLSFDDSGGNDLAEEGEGGVLLALGGVRSCLFSI